MYVCMYVSVVYNQFTVITLGKNFPIQHSWHIGSSLKCLCTILLATSLLLVPTTIVYLCQLKQQLSILSEFSHINVIVY